MTKKAYLILSLLLIFSCQTEKEVAKKPVQISGIYPHLAHDNNENECGTGAVVPWADRLWVITYAPHKPNGSSDKLYEITSEYSSMNSSQLRICREVATERDLFNCHSTFYELPAENADGFAKIRPIASHNFRVHDYASYRGMLIMTGIIPDANASEHIIRSEDGQAAVWAGVIDDLWKLGKPTGQGGPWNETAVEANIASDPYLIGFYDQKSLTISHNSNEVIKFTVEVEPIGHGPWMIYQEVNVKPGETFQHTFPESFHARWIRFRTNKNCEATTWLEYK